MERLKEYVGEKDLEIVEIETKLYDIRIFTKPEDDSQFTEAVISMRTENGSNQFVQIPVVSIIQKEELS
jgi:hypothetical protein